MATTTTMLEAVVSGDTTVELRRVPIPSPGPMEVLIRVHVAGSNPKDWKRPMWQQTSQNSGDDIAGTVVSCGSSVRHLFAPGTRVAALHTLGGPHGAFAEYSVALADMTFALPDAISFEEAATLPLAAMTAATGLFLRQGLPMPWGDRDPQGTPSHGGGADTRTVFEREQAGGEKEGEKEEEKEESTTKNDDTKLKPSHGPFVIYGAASAVGAFAVQLAKAAHIGPLICVAGKGIPFVESMLDKDAGDIVLDYREGEEALISALATALAATTTDNENRRVLQRAFDCITASGSYTILGHFLAPQSNLTTVHRAAMMPGGKFEGVPDNVRLTESYVVDVPLWFPRFGAACCALFEHGLREGWLRGHPVQVVDGGLGGVERGLRDLREGKNSAVKYVFRVDETAGLKEGE